MRKLGPWLLAGVLTPLALLVSSCSAPLATSSTAARSPTTSPVSHRLSIAPPTEGLDEIPTSDLADFPKPIAQALVYLEDEHLSVPMPILAPSFLPSSSKGPSSLKGVKGGISVVAQGSLEGYSVTFYRCRKELPVNSPQIGMGQCASLDNVVGAFGGRLEPSAAIAEKRLPQISSADATSSPTSCPDGFEERSQSVSLRPGLEGELLSCLGGSTSNNSTKELSLSWQMASWHLVVVLGGEVQWQPVAESILHVLKDQPLPTTIGSMMVDASGASKTGYNLHTALAWAWGKDVYTVASYNSLEDAISMATSMRKVSF